MHPGGNPAMGSVVENYQHNRGHILAAGLRGSSWTAGSNAVAFMRSAMFKTPCHCQSPVNIFCLTRCLSWLLYTHKLPVDASHV